MSLRAQFFSHIANTSPFPLGLEIVKADGVYLFDPAGKKYIDFISGIGVNNLGHAHPDITKAIHNQADDYLHTMVYGEHIQSPQVRLAQKLTENLPINLNKVFFLTSGAEAIDGAIKTARKSTGRKKIYAFKNAYHGSTYGAMSLMNDASKTSPYGPGIADVFHFDFNDLTILENIDHTTAAVIMEVVQSERGGSRGEHVSASSPLGKPQRRQDGRAKVTGAATYAGEPIVDRLLHGVVVNARIARGRIRSLDTAAALAVPGVHTVFTHKNRPSLALFDRSYRDDDAPAGSPFRPLRDGAIVFGAQPIALVVTEDLETTRYAATLVEVAYEVETPETDLATSWKRRRKPKKGKLGYGGPPKPRGEPDEARARSAHALDVRYELPVEHHNPMEMHASTVIVEADLQRLAVRLSVDDFGTDRSSFSYVKRRSTGVLKIDRSLVRGLPHSTHDARITTAIIAMARSLGLEVIAEGVKTAAQVDFLQRANCGKLQGYLFSRPLPADDVEHLLRQGRITLPGRSAVASGSKRRIGG